MCWKGGVSGGYSLPKIFKGHKVPILKGIFGAFMEIVFKFLGIRSKDFLTWTLILLLKVKGQLSFYSQILNLNIKGISGAGKLIE